MPWIGRQDIRGFPGPIRYGGETDPNKQKSRTVPKILEPRIRDSSVYTGDCPRSQSARRRGGALLKVGDLARLVS
jgi:hypothetical protein